jgi:hypothetical protein
MDFGFRWLAVGSRGGRRGRLYRWWRFVQWGVKFPLNVLRGAAEFRQPLAKGSGQFGQPLAAEQKKNHDEDKEDLGTAEIHGLRSLMPLQDASSGSGFF